MTVVLDTNIWVSLALNRQLEFIANLHKNGTIIVSCENLVNELIDVLLRPKFHKNFPKNYVENHSLSPAYNYLIKIVPHRTRGYR
ncbi:MAG: hypothetical protein JWR02_1883 [Mucilaginibacter sp.]|nr:hypothetical protein [Mucilaginibacter sp.]